MFRKYLRAYQRAVAFRLGKLVKIVGPGLVVTIPALDQVHVVKLDEMLPGPLGQGSSRGRGELFRMGVDWPNLVIATDPQNAGG